MNNKATPEKKIDTELLKVINDAIAGSKSYGEALDKVIKSGMEIQKARQGGRTLNNLSLSPVERQAKQFFASRGIKPSLAEFREVCACIRNGSKPLGIH